MEYEELLRILQHSGKQPARLIFEDELTGISNRRYLRNYLEHKVPWATPDDYQLSMLMMDLDGFKQLNDTYGHQRGDEALVALADLLRELAGTEHLPIRYAGDEFVVLMPGSTRADARALANRLVERVR